MNKQHASAPWLVGAVAVFAALAVLLGIARISSTSGDSGEVIVLDPRSDAVGNSVSKSYVSGLADEQVLALSSNNTIDLLSIDPSGELEFEFSMSMDGNLDPVTLASQDRISPVAWISESLVIHRAPSIQSNDAQAGHSLIGVEIGLLTESISQSWKVELGGQILGVSHDDDWLYVLARHQHSTAHDAVLPVYLDVWDLARLGEATPDHSMDISSKFPAAAQVQPGLLLDSGSVLITAYLRDSSPINVGDSVGLVAVAELGSAGLSAVTSTLSFLPRATAFDGGRVAMARHRSSDVALLDLASTSQLTITELITPSIPVIDEVALFDDRLLVGGRSGAVEVWSVPSGGVGQFADSFTVPDRHNVIQFMEFESPDEVVVLSTNRPSIVSFESSIAAINSDDGDGLTRFGEAHVHDDVLYVADENGALHVVDIQDLAAPVVVESIAASELLGNGKQVWQIAAMSDTLLLTAERDVALLGLADPLSPTVQGLYPDLLDSSGVGYSYIVGASLLPSGDAALLSDAARLTRFEVTNPVSLSLASVITTTSGDALQLNTSASEIIVGTGVSGKETNSLSTTLQSEISRFKVNVAGQLEHVATASPVAGFSGMCTTDDLSFVVVDQAVEDPMIQVFDLSGGSISPMQTYSVPAAVQGRARSVDCDDDLLVFADSIGTIHIWSLSPAGSLTLETSLLDAAGDVRLILNDDTLYVVQPRAISIYDVSVPGSPELQGALEGSG